jgi:uncharacterized protein
MKKHKIIILIILMLVSFFVFLNFKKDKIFFSENFFFVDIISKKEDLIRGLSGRKEMEDNSGLLMVFQNDDYHGIWMKNMFFPIDILWLNQNLEVVYIKESVLPETFPEVFRPKEKSRYVLEVSSGMVERFNISTGDKATLNWKLLKKSAINN